MSISTLLVVEDDDLDYLALQRELLTQEWAPQVVRATDGLDALDQLELALKYGPCIVVLDLSLPRMSGLEFLATLREEKKYESTPIFVLTTSENSQDLQAAYEHGVSGYFVKKSEDGTYGQVIQMIRLYAETVQLPI